LRKIFLEEKKPAKVVLLIQKEMAVRITAAPGSSERGFLTLLTEANATAKIIRTVKPGSFYPRPKVDSAIIELTLLPKSRSADIFWPAVEAGFRHKRQTLVNSLANDLHLPKDQAIALVKAQKLDALIRPQNLSFEDWANLSKELIPLVTATKS